MATGSARPAKWLDYCDGAGCESSAGMVDFLGRDKNRWDWRFIRFGVVSTFRLFKSLSQRFGEVGTFHLGVSTHSRSHI